MLFMLCDFGIMFVVFIIESYDLATVLLAVAIAIAQRLYNGHQMSVFSH